MSAERAYCSPEERQDLQREKNRAAVTMLEDAVRQMTAGYTIKISPET